MSSSTSSTSSAPKALWMDPIKAIESSDELIGRINQLASAIRLETEDNAEQWDGLSRAGGQRADHAAMLMGRLRPALAELARFCSVVEQQIDGMVADPFGRDRAE